jgi:hypothetical protein
MSYIMKNSFKRFSVLFLSLAVMALSFQSCKKKFDEPPVGDLPNLTANATIAEIQALHTVGNNASEITEDKIIEGLVVSSDEAGNFYKQLILMDSTGGIELRIDVNNLNGNYPVGTKVWVRLNGLFVGDYEGNYQLTINANGDRIPEGLLGEYVVAGAVETVTPNQVSISDILTNPSLRNTLVQLDNVQFTSSDTNQTYADAIGQQSENRTLQDCNGNVILVRSSGFADFASDRTPGANGTITAVYTNFGSDAQLYIRNTDDVAFSSVRCSPSSNVGGNLTPIATVRAAYTGSAGSAPTNTKVKGYVISDRSTNNIVDKNVVIMDENANGGILVRFASAHSLDLGDYVEFATDGGTLSEYNQLLQLEGLNEANFNIISTGNAVPPLNINFSTFLADAETYESMLIKLDSVRITGNATFGFNEITDGTNIVDLYTSSFATFSSTSVPNGCQNVTGIVGQFNADYQLTLRDPSLDLETGVGCGGGGGPVGNETVIGLDSVRILFNGGATSIPGARKISGTIISDGANGNIFDDNFVIQDATGGVQVRLTGTHSFALGDSVEVIVSGASLGESSGLLRIGNSGGVANSNVTVISSGHSVTPRVATVTDLLANAETWESTLVQVQSATITGDATYGFNDVTDATGTIDMFTPGSATFSSTSVPTGSVNITAILGQYDTTAPTDSGYQLRIRNTSDVQ